MRLSIFPARVLADFPLANPLSKPLAKSLAALGALTVATGCSLPGNWSSAGLSFDIESGTFSGLPLTTAAQMPAGGTANFTGEYRNLSRSNPFGKGTATFGVDFAAGTVNLNLSGSVNDSASGTINGTGFSGTSGFSFWGDFYNPGATVAAGQFTGAGGNQNSVGQFIVSR